MIYIAIGWCVCRRIARGFFALQVEGAEHVPSTGPVILAPNHVSYLDPTVVGVSIRRHVHFMGRKELFKHPGAAWFLRGVYAYPVTRGHLPLWVRFGPPLRFARHGEFGCQALEVFGRQSMEANAALRHPGQPSMLNSH